MKVLIKDSYIVHERKKVYVYKVRFYTQYESLHYSSSIPADMVIHDTRMLIYVLGR